MSDKKRRDITLGEMQDECKKHKKCQGECPFELFCTEQRTLKDPSKWNLTDPPRFNEKQMAFWRGLYTIGARSSKRDNARVYIYDASESYIGSLEYRCITKHVDLGIKDGETLDLAEMFGKEGTK